MLLSGIEQTLAYMDILGIECYLTKTELWQLHRWFGHLSIAWLYRLLTEADQTINMQALKQLTKFC